MQCKTLVIWWLINGKKPKLLEEEDKIIKNLEPLVKRLFPGINYFSVTGFDAVMRTLVVPALKKQFVDLINLPEEEIAAEQMSEVAEVLPSKGYEWQDDPAWQVRFQELLAA